MSNNSITSRLLSLTAIVVLLLALFTSGAFSATSTASEGCHGYGPSDGKNDKGWCE